MKNSASILLVEDDLVDVMTVRRALQELRVTNPLHVVHDGEEALAWLRRPGQPAPGVILLDLNMPRMNGLEFLEVAKQDPHLRRLPVVVLTTSKEEHDRVRSFQLSVAGYMVKPVDYRQFVEVIRTIQLYWTLSESAS
ncbi:MAG: response regulator [Verrucomicrobia bacterium]|nr:response regulator [Verrucomicrobiota bacterium]